MIGIEDRIYKIEDFKFCNHEGTLFAAEWRDREEDWINWLSYHPVDFDEDLVNALNYFKDNGLLIKLSGCGLRQLIKNTIGGTSLNCGFNRFDFIKDYAVWRYFVLANNNFRCECCGSQNDLQVHHNRSFKEHLELATDFFNGTALCKDCHSKFHTLYGYNNISGTEVYEFIRKYGRRSGK